MKSTLIVFLLLLITLFTLSNPLSIISASGELKIATQSDTIYLTTSTTSETTATPTPTPVATASSATTIIPTQNGQLPLPPGFFGSANELVNDLFKVIMIFAVILVFAYLVLGGFQYIMSGGEKGKTEQARNKITSAIIGLIIVASSYAILTIVLNFIGFRDVSGMLRIGSIASPSPTPSPIITPTPTPSSLLQQLIK